MCLLIEIGRYTWVFLVPHLCWASTCQMWSANLLLQLFKAPLSTLHQVILYACFTLFPLYIISSSTKVSSAESQAYLVYACPARYLAKCSNCSHRFTHFKKIKGVYKQLIPPNLHFFNLFYRKYHILVSLFLLDICKASPYLIYCCNALFFYLCFETIFSFCNWRVRVHAKCGNKGGCIQFWSSNDGIVHQEKEKSDRYNRKQLNTSAICGKLSFNWAGWRELWR